MFDTERQKTIAKRLRDLREKRGLTREQLSLAIMEKCNHFISKQMLQQYEEINEKNAKWGSVRGMSTEKLYYLAKFYEVSTEYILGLTDIKTKDTELAAVCEYTGLSEEMVEQLHYDKEFYNSFASHYKLTTTWLLDKIYPYLRKEAGMRALTYIQSCIRTRAYENEFPELFSGEFADEIKWALIMREEENAGIKKTLDMCYEEKETEQPVSLYHLQKRIVEAVEKIAKAEMPDITVKKYIEIARNNEDIEVYNRLKAFVEHLKKEKGR